MLPIVALIILAWLLCVAFFQSAVAAAPEGFEDEAGFHYVSRPPAPVGLPAVRG